VVSSNDLGAGPSEVAVAEQKAFVIAALANRYMFVQVVHTEGLVVDFLVIESLHCFRLVESIADP
jgi:hypothetical protein